MSFILARAHHYGKLYKGYIFTADHSGGIMSQGKTLYVGSSHLVPLEMVSDHLQRYGVVCVQLAHFSIGDWRYISIAHVIIIIKSEVSTFSIVVIFFPWLCVWDVVTTYSVTYCIYIPGKPGICLHLYCAVYDECKWSDTFWLLTGVFVVQTRVFPLTWFDICIPLLCIHHK